MKKAMKWIFIVVATYSAAIFLSMLWTEYATWGSAMAAIVLYPLFVLVAIGRTFENSWIEAAIGLAGIVFVLTGVLLRLAGRKCGVILLIGIFLMSLNVLKAFIAASSI